jgi:Ca2+-binding EF-hand superfamily protein
MGELLTGDVAVHVRKRLCPLAPLMKSRVAQLFTCACLGRTANRHEPIFGRNKVVRSIIAATATAAFAVSSAAIAQQAGSAAPQTVKRSDFAAKLDSGFATADSNHDGFLSAAEIQTEQNKELQNVRAALQTKLRTAFNQLDTNKDGQLSFAEFSAQTVGAVKPTETAAQVFQQLDANHDGKISPAEFKAPRLSAFDKADLNHDGVVTPDEMRRSNGQK